MTNIINLTDLAKSLTPRANLVGPTGQPLTPKSGVSMADLLSQGVPATFIEKHLQAGSKIVELPDMWADEVRRNNAKAMQTPPAATPTPAQTAAKAVSDASKRTFSVPYQAKAVPVNETPEQELARLRSENERLKTAKATQKLSFKVSEKGAVSVYGMGRFPVTLYGEQWVKLANAMPELVDFLKANAHLLSSKDDK